MEKINTHYKRRNVGLTFQDMRKPQRASFTEIFNSCVYNSMGTRLVFCKLLKPSNAWLRRDIRKALLGRKIPIRKFKSAPGTDVIVCLTPLDIWPPD